MISNKEKIKYIDNIQVINCHDELKYITKLKDGFKFILTNSNVVITYNISDLNKVINHGIKWGN